MIGGDPAWSGNNRLHEETMIIAARRVVRFIACRATRPATAIAALAAAILSLSVASAAMAAGDEQAGKDLARRWCSGCHIVDRSGGGTDAAPPFPVIARRNPKDRTWLRAWLTDPHPPMPNLNLSRQQIDDVVAYLDSLSPR